MTDEIVVTAAAGQGPQFAAAIERFENNPGVVGETPDYPEVDLHELPEASQAKSFDDTIQFLASTFAIENLEG
jgi:hypothetical protein